MKVMDIGYKKEVRQAIGSFWKGITVSENGMKLAIVNILLT